MHPGLTLAVEGLLLAWDWRVGLDPILGCRILRSSWTAFRNVFSTTLVLLILAWRDDLSTGGIHPLHLGSVGIARGLFCFVGECLVLLLFWIITHLD